MLKPASAADKAKAAATVESETFHPGSVVTATRLKGATATDRLVVLAEQTGGTYKVGVLGGSPTYWSKVPGSLLRRAAI